MRLLGDGVYYSMALIAILLFTMVHLLVLTFLFSESKFLDLLSSIIALTPAITLATPHPMTMNSTTGSKMGFRSGKAGDQYNTTFPAHSTYVRKFFMLHNLL